MAVRQEVKKLMGPLVMMPIGRTFQVAKKPVQVIRMRNMMNMKEKRRKKRRKMRREGEIQKQRWLMCSLT